MATADTGGAAAGGGALGSEAAGVGVANAGGDEARAGMVGTDAGAVGTGAVIGGVGADATRCSGTRTCSGAGTGAAGSKRGRLEGFLGCSSAAIDNPRNVMPHGRWILCRWLPRAGNRPYSPRSCPIHRYPRCIRWLNSSVPRRPDRDGSAEPRLSARTSSSCGPRIASGPAFWFGRIAGT